MTAELPSILRAKAEKFGLPYERVGELQDRNELEKFLEVLNKDPKVDPLLVANYPGVTLDFYSWAAKEKPANGTIRQVFAALKSGRSFKDAIGNVKVVDIGALEKVVQQVIDENPEVVARYKAGESKLLGFLTGQVVQRAGGGADPSSVSALLNKLLAQ